MAFSDDIKVSHSREAPLKVAVALRAGNAQIRNSVVVGAISKRTILARTISIQVPKWNRSLRLQNTSQQRRQDTTPAYEPASESQYCGPAEAEILTKESRLSKIPIIRSFFSGRREDDTMMVAA